MSNVKSFYLLLLLLAAPLHADETESEWKVLAQPADLKVTEARDTALKLIPEYLGKEAEYDTELKRLQKLLSAELKPITLAELTSLTEVRSIQVSKLGTFSYPYFKCGFTKYKDGVTRFKKLTGSQRKSGPVYKEDDKTLVLLAASTVNDEAPRTYSGISKSEDTEYDAPGIIIKAGNKVLAIFPESNGRFEIYEFR